MKYGQLRICPTDQWAQFAAVHVSSILIQRLEANPYAHVSMSLAGGSTPAPVYRALVELSEPVIDWNRVDLFLGDERMVPNDHQESNYAAACKSLSSPRSGSVPRIHHVKTDLSPDAAAWKYDTWIRRTIHNAADHIPSIDLVLLGLGSDGHTASLFPGANTLAEQERLVVPAVHPDTGQNRVTLTLPVLKAARTIMFLVRGPEKSDIVSQIAKTDPTPDLPASLVAAQAQQLFWMLDETAAGQVL